MLYGLYVSAAGALANRYRMDVVTNNLANAQTVSFKRDLAMFQGRQTRSAQTNHPYDTAKLLEGIGGGLFALPTHTDFTPAALETTGGMLDVALQGRGFFTVQGADGTNYTRDGRFKLNENHQLVTVDGDWPVLDEQGAPIEIDSEAGPVVITESGVISQDGNAIAQLNVVDFQDAQVLKKMGRNLYRTEGNATAEPIAARVKQGCLETSGINPVEELTSLISSQRLFDTNMNVLEMQNNTLQLAVSKLGRIS